ncbi:MAG: zf-HC2 domain-containing protein, partial [Clostridia bacterium]|nr:zf-HC2 domain-containing protein [Clostridia bacterium]
MNDQTKCSVVRDLLPNYIENLTSEATSAFVSEHLAECEACRAVHRAMTGQLSKEEISTQAMVSHMKRQRKLRRLRAWAAALALVLAAVAC